MQIRPFPILPAPTFNLSPLKENHYGLAKIDPPWAFKTYSDKGKGKSAEQHYDTMTLEEIYELDVERLAHRDGMWVWLYATAPMYDQARECFRRWNVTYVRQGVWVKMVKDGSKPTFGTGYALRNCHEPFLIGKVGKPKIHARDIRSAILEPRREHSHKPEQGYVEAAKMAGPYPKADIFSREQRLGWDAWGDQIEKFNKPEMEAA
ncbi:MT-A70 family methyltransferase [Bradyrhizobium elkanii]|uniref:MT-A70 family methyltransferase n=1 Tax=Bradyrhizobium elkanii TaxID=29448 RepID=UPI00271217BF|nr:MT-A70 family methyltransferase [Bradyrhizobium elkanii]WLA44131.1 MT-A70 family methyltransferase [Bradyrhizobium elkanii]